MVSSLTREKPGFLSSVNTAISIGDNSVDDYVNHGVRRIGGCACNAAIYLQRAGIPTAYLGVVGKDPEGEFVRERLRGQGLDLSHLHVVPGRTGYTRVSVQGGERVFLSEELGVGKDFPLSAGDVEFIARHTLAHFYIWGFGAEHLAELHARGVITSFDFSSPDHCTPEQLSAIIPHVDLAFFSGAHLQSEDAARQFARAMQARGPQVVAVTLGGRGSLAFDGREFYRQRAFETTVVDTLGAGDAFIGTFLARYLSGDSIPACLEAGSRVAAQVCAHLGGWEWII